MLTEVLIQTVYKTTVIILKLRDIWPIFQPFPSPKVSILLFLKLCVDTVPTKGKHYKIQAQTQHVTLHNKTEWGRSATMPCKTFPGPIKKEKKMTILD